MQNLPLVSVYIPTKNRPELLKRAVDSVLNQSYKQIEVIVCDDGSESENFQYICESYKDKNNVIIVNNTSGVDGACGARNVAISLAKGIYITGLDDDDIMHRDRIREFIDNWDDKYAFLCAKNCNGSGIYSRIKRCLDRNILISLEMLKSKNYVGNQVFTLTKLLREYRFNEKLPALQDWELWLRLLSKTSKDGLMLAKRLQFVDTNHGHLRITTYENRINALSMIDSHYLLGVVRKRKLILLWKVEANHSVSLFEMLRYPSFGMFIYLANRLVRYFVR